MGVNRIVEVSGRDLITVSGIICITILELAAIFKGIDGVALSAVVAAIGTIVGHAYGKSKATP